MSEPLMSVAPPAQNQSTNEQALVCGPDDGFVGPPAPPQDLSGPTAPAGPTDARGAFPQAAADVPTYHELPSISLGKPGQGPAPVVKKPKPKPKWKPPAAPPPRQTAFEATMKKVDAETTKDMEDWKKSDRSRAPLSNEEIGASLNKSRQGAWKNAKTDAERQAILKEEEKQQSMSPKQYKDTKNLNEKATTLYFQNEEQKQLGGKDDTKGMTDAQKQKYFKTLEEKQRPPKH